MSQVAQTSSCIKDRQLLVLITIFFHQASGLVTSRPLDEKSLNSLIHAETSEEDSQKIGVRCLRASWERWAWTHTQTQTLGNLTPPTTSERPRTFTRESSRCNVPWSKHKLEEKRTKTKLVANVGLIVGTWTRLSNAKNLFDCMPERLSAQVSASERLCAHVCAVQNVRNDNEMTYFSILGQPATAGANSFTKRSC